MTVELAILIFGALAAFVGALGGLGGLAALLSIRSTRGRTDAEAGKAGADAAATLIGGASEFVGDMRRELDFTRKRVDELQEQLQNGAQKSAILQETLDHAMARLTMLETENESLRGQVELLRQRLTELETENERLRGDREHV